MDTFILSQITKSSPTKRTFRNAIKAFGKPVYDFLYSQGVIHEIDLTSPHRHCEAMISIKDPYIDLFYEALPANTEFYHDFMDFVHEYKNMYNEAKLPEYKFMVCWINLTYSDVVSGYKKQCIFVSTHVPSFFNIIKQLKQSPDYHIDDPMFATPVFPNHRQSFITVRLPDSRLIMTKRYHVHKLTRFIPECKDPLTILAVIDLRKL
jgi:hypothetical protein